MTSDSWVVILGGGSDIGLGIAATCAKNKHNICLAGRNLELLERSARDIQIRYGVEVLASSFDAEDLSDCNAFYERLPFVPFGVVAAFGFLPTSIDFRTPEKDVCRTLLTNSVGTIAYLEAAIDVLLEQDRGFVVAISSVAGDRGRKSNYIYGASKAAVSTYMAGLNHRLLNSPIVCLCVKPGFVRTKMTSSLDLPAPVTASPSEVGRLVYRAIEKKRDTVYVKPVWKFIMMIITHMPKFFFNKLNI